MDELLDGQQELFPVTHQRSTIPRCGDCGRFLRPGLPCLNPRCYGDGAYSHIPVAAIHIVAAHIPAANGRDCIQYASEALAAAWPHILSTINPRKADHALPAKNPGI